MRFITGTGEMDPELSKIKITDNLKGCDAYIATGSNRLPGIFDYYLQIPAYHPNVKPPPPF